MRICRFTRSGEMSFGVVDGDVEAGTATVTAIAGHPFAPFQLQGDPVPLSSVRLLSPVLPSKVVAIGKNYADHVAEMADKFNSPAPAEPVLFLKPSTSVVGPGDPIVYPHLSQEVHHEAELAIVISRLCKEVPIERAHEVILGYTCANDVTARDLQQRDGQWARAKGLDTFCPLGPWVVTGEDLSDVDIACTVNGEVRQRGRTSDLIRGIPELVSYVSAAMTLLPGDVILTGTPAGVGPISIGDDVKVTIGKIGTLSNRVVAPADRLGASAA